jgi:hypothetical protein
MLGVGCPGRHALPLTPPKTHRPSRVLQSRESGFVHPPVADPLPFVGGSRAGCTNCGAHAQGPCLARAFKWMREAIEAMMEIWTKPEAQYRYFLSDRIKTLKAIRAKA